MGLFCTTPAVPVVRSLPPKLTFEMLCTGDSISAEEAHRHGIVNRFSRQHIHSHLSATVYDAENLINKIQEPIR